VDKCQDGNRHQISPESDCAGRISFSKSGILGKEGKSAKKYLKKLQLFVKVSLKNCLSLINRVSRESGEKKTKCG
jgi:hypothetical protein